jgi:hypothetical protein
VNSAAFGVLAAILIVGALVASFGTSLRLSISALAVVALAAVVFFAALSAFSLAVGTLIIALGFAFAFRRQLMTARSHLVSAESRQRWWAFAVVPLIGGVVLTAVVAKATGWHEGSSASALITVFHYRYPIVGVVAVAAILIGLASAWINVTLQHDEQSHHQLKADKAAQAERMARRRADREAARQRRRERRTSE